jgi:hypothetical protein
MITAKAALEYTLSHNRDSVKHLLEKPEMGKMTKYICGKIESAAKSGHHFVFLSNDDIFKSSGRKRRKSAFGQCWKDMEWSEPLDDILKQYGFAVEHCYQPNIGGWGISIEW